MIIVLMGVSGSGKTTIGTLLARRMHTVFADADTYHSDANKAKMAGGYALNDEDRQPWLETLNALMRNWFEHGGSGVLACSALKEIYRATLVRGMPEGSIIFVFLDGSREMIAQRLAGRHDHYMNPKLLDSQIAALEPPSNAMHIVNDRAPEDVVDEIISKFAA